MKNIKNFFFNFPENLSDWILADFLLSLLPLLTHFPLPFLSLVSLNSVVSRVDGTPFLVLKVSTKGKRGSAAAAGGGRKRSKAATRDTSTPSTSAANQPLPPHIQAQLDVVPPPTQMYQHADLMAQARMAQASATWWPGASGASGGGNGYLQIPDGSQQFSPGATPQRSPSSYPVYPHGYPPPQGPAQGQHISRNEQFYRSRGFYPPGSFGPYLGIAKGWIMNSASSS